ncbi:MAG: PD40 domain-containing protein [Microbacteriaceae bacterium]|nr:PD40 domain-containing protein [Microbacteriaceae bacterium]
MITLILLGAAITYGASAIASYRARLASPSQVSTTTHRASDPGGIIRFRNTAAGTGYGMTASVPVADPGAPRALTTLACDRVYATKKNTMCLRIVRGIVTTFEADLLDSTGKQLHAWSLPGIPSRTRISPDSTLVAFTSFVTRAAYGTVGFSTATEVATTTGLDYGNLETFAFTIDGQPVTAPDRNFWGVTFTSDDNVFYATAASGGRTWLVRADLAKRNLTAVKETSECPSVSPDGRRVAYKKNTSTTATAYWAIAVLDLKTRVETILSEKRNIDDQVEWLNESTLLYGLPRSNGTGDSDIWSIPADGSGSPTRIIQHAWSPTVVR